MYFKEHIDLYMCKIPRSTNAQLARTRNIKCGVINILVASARISPEISHGMSTGEFENDPLRGQGPGAEVPYRGICWRATAASTAEREVRGSQTLIVRGRYWMSSRERLRGFERAPYLTSTSIHPSFSIHHRHPARVAISVTPTTLRHSFVVRCATHIRSVSVPPDPFQQLSRDGKNPPVTLKGESQLSYPICPYFS